jgi:hypothetical protein
VSRAEQANAFCSALLGGPDGDDRLEGLFVTLWTSGDKRTRWRRADQPGAVASLVAELDEQDSSQAVYICTTLSSDERSCAEYHDGNIPHGEGNCKHRPKAVESAGLLGLWVEFDIAGPGHESEFLPPDRNHVQKIIDAMVVKPTLVVSSGGGLHCWWMLAEPWLVRDADDQDAERQKMAKLERDWVLTARHHAEVLGRWQVDSVHDLARLLRPAGTTNRKIAGTPRPVTIVSHDPEAVYNPDDFAEFMPDPETLEAYGAAKGADNVRLTMSDAEKEMLKEVNLTAVWMRVNSAEYRALDYTPDWLAEILELAAESAEMGEDTRKQGKNQGATPSLLVNTWNGDRPDLKDDQSSLDASLVRLLADLGFVDTEGIIEAMMCRRLRLTDSTKADKLDPRKRIDYIVRTVARFRLTAKLAVDRQKLSSDRLAEMANMRLEVNPRPEPEPEEVTADKRGVVLDDKAAAKAGTDYMVNLVEHRAATEEEKRRDADDQVKAAHTGVTPPPRPTPALPAGEDDDEEEPKFFNEDRPKIEQECMDELTALLIPQVYRERGVMVWGLEVRDEGEKQKGRFMLRVPVDFRWPVDEARPSRYRPGRPLFTDWWGRDAFDGQKGFEKALRHDLKMAAQKTPPKEWSSLLDDLVPLWRRDSSGSDIATYSHDWLYDYLMLHHGTGEPNEVGASGRPWVRKTNGWKPSTPPIIFIDLKEFLEHCRRQPGAVAGREIKGVLDHLHLTIRRPRIKAPGMMSRPTFYEIAPEEFDANEWAAIIDVTRHSYEISQNKRGLRLADADTDSGGVSISDGRREAQ